MSTSRRAERDARQPRRLQHARHRQPVPRPHAGREPGALSRDARRPAWPMARWCCAPRSTWPRPTSTCATRRSTASSAPRTTTPATRWCIYPMYTYAHPIEDALENITHSICTLEFEDQRPFYDWLLDTLCEPRPAGAAAAAPVRVRAPEPHLRRHQQAQAAGSWSTRGIVERLGRPAHADHRRPAPARLHAGRPSACWPSAPAPARPTAGSTTPALDIALRDDLEGKAPRAMAVLDPLQARADQLGRGLRRRRTASPASAPVHPQRPELGQRRFGLGPEVWIERDDFAEVPPKGFFRRLLPRATRCG